MIAAQKFNTSKGNEISVIYGGVTNSKLWQFFKLEGKNVTIDRHQYYVMPVERILGILKWMADESGELIVRGSRAFAHASGRLTPRAIASACGIDRQKWVEYY